MKTSLPTGTGLQVLSICAFGLTIFAICALYYLFTQMDMSRANEFSNKLELEEDAPGDDKKASLASSGGGQNNDNDNDHNSSTKRPYLTQYRRIVLMLTVAIITILVYLILVFSNAPAWLEWVGMLIVLVLLGPILQYGDEIRRQRYDRLALMLTLILILATGLNMAVYAANQYADEDIYKGMARIISYQDDSYNNAEGETVTRTDLMVSWGGEWGCPHNPSQFCEAAIPGALCDSTMYEDYGDRRHLQDEEGDGDGEEEANQDGNGEGDNGDDAATDDVAVAYAQLQEDYEALEQQYEQLEANYNTLQEQNQNLQSDLATYEEAYDELEEDYDYMYYWDDDVYYDSYWDEQSWTDIWGDYQCTEMFEYDLEGMTYEENTAPGEDGWPYLNIYGNCDTCEAFIVDFYSTEHFQEISSYKKSAVHYAVSAIFASIVTIALMVKQRFSPQAENEIELLPSAGNGAMA